MANKYKIGEMFTVKEDYEGTLALSETKKTIRKGSKIIIGADRLAHHMNDGMIQPLSKDAEVEGYDAEGLAEFIFHDICNYLPFCEFLEEYGGEFEINKDGFIDAIESALTEIGLC